MQHHTALTIMFYASVIVTLVTPLVFFVFVQLLSVFVSIIQITAKNLKDILLIIIEDYDRSISAIKMIHIQN